MFKNCLSERNLWLKNFTLQQIFRITSIIINIINIHSVSPGYSKFSRQTCVFPHRNILRLKNALQLKFRVIHTAASNVKYTITPPFKFFT